MFITMIYLIAASINILLKNPHETSKSLNSSFYQSKKVVWGFVLDNNETG